MSPGSWIVAIAKTRDQAAFAKLFQSFTPKLKAYLMRKGALEPAAEELAQDVLLAIWRKADQFDPASTSPAGWIYAIARNLAVDAYRREVLSPDHLAHEVPEPTPTPLSVLERHEVSCRIVAAMDALPDGQAEAMRLAFYGDESHPQIAARLACPVGTVKSRIRLASSRLRLVLTEEDA